MYELGKSVTPFDERLGDPTSLTKLIVTGLNAYPNAEQVLLSLVGHGGGWSPLLLAGQPTSHYGQSGLGGLLWDDTPGTSLSTIELGAALKAAFAATGRKIDLLYLDACLMGMYEVAYEIKDSVNYLLASASWAWTSFAYDAHLRALKTPQPADEIAQMWMQNEASILRPDNLPFTYSVVDLKQMDTLKLAIDRLAKSLIVLTTDEVDRVRIATAAKATDCFDSNQDIMITQADTYCDLMSFTRKLNELFAGNAEVVDAIRNVQTALPKVVVDKDQQNGKPNRFASEQWEWDSPGGLAIYLPLREDEWKRRYYKNRDDEDGLLFAKDGEWDDFIQLYWGEKEPPDDPPCPPCQVQPGHLEILQKFYQPILLR
ncbi:hypothetical protein KFU94_06110 [Chloroflexi bacterium TSY]|nr:hypothetical protein [Chloroflexi bacterium TSY]